MIAANVAALLQALETEQPSLTIEEVVQQVRQRTQSSSRSAVLKHCSLVRSFDEGIYNLVCKDLPGEPSFSVLVNEAAGRDRSTADILSDGHGWWRVAEMTRAHYLKEWQTSDLEKWKKWNEELAKYFLAQPGTSGQEANPFAQVNALYHLAVANPDRALELFPKWFSDADKAFDLAQCNALLEVLRTQENWRGSKLSAAWQAHRQHYLARSLFLQDYYKTAAYLEREGPLAAFRKVLNRTERNPWIFHIHATGGIGKTMFLRWLISRELIPAKIPCARVDFDDFKTIAEVVNAPLRLMVRIVEQLDQQLPHASLTSLLERLKREQDSPGWNTSVLAELQRHFKGARIDTPVAIVLDTLEEPTLSHAQWLRESIGQFREFLGSIPKLLLILSGRYNVVERIPELDDDEYHHYELTSFTGREAEQFLVQRGVGDSSVRKAIIQKIGGAPFTGANPFMLALLTELVLNRKGLTPPDIEKLPRVDFAYLIERIVLRIESQPLRWVIRYGAIARDLTPGFIKHVLLDPLKDALEGKLPADQPRQAAMEGMEQYKDVWVPDPEAAARLDPTSLWKELTQFERDRGWISLVDGKTQIARFHPEVINPTRDLLRNQPIFKKLQISAITYFEGLAKKAETPEAWAAAASEALFHRFQLDGPEASPYWESMLERARKHGIDATMRIAQEIIERDYAEGEMKPLAWGNPPRQVIFPETLARAHCVIAELLLERAGVALLAETPQAKEFRRHVELAQTISNQVPGLAVAPFLRAFVAALDQTSPAAALEKLENVRAGDEREQFLLEIQTAELCARLRRPETPEHYRRAFQLRDRAGLTSIQAHEILLRLADWHRFAGDYSGTMDALRRARELRDISEEGLAAILQREVITALAANDLQAAEETVGELWSTVASREGYHGKEVLLFEAQIALEKDDVVGVARRCEQLLPGPGGQPAQTAQVYDLLGRAAARRYDFDETFDHFERASKLYDDARIITGSARCGVLRMRTAALVQRRLRDAEATLRHTTSLPGARDVEVHAELELLRAFILWKSGRGDEARPRIEHLVSEKVREWPTRLAARLMFWAFATGWHAPTPDFVKRLITAIEDVQPVSARFLLLDILEHTTRGIQPDSVNAGDLLKLFPRASRDSDAFIDTTIARARLYFLLGDEAEALTELGMAQTHRLKGAPPEAGFLKQWRINRCALQLGAPTGFGSMAGAQPAGLLDSSPFMGVVKLEAGMEAIKAGLLSVAQPLLDWAEKRLSGGSYYSLWQARLHEARSAMAVAQGQSRKAEDELESAARLYDQLNAVEEAERVRRSIEALQPAAASLPSSAEPPELAPRIEAQAPGTKPSSQRFIGVSSAPRVRLEYGIEPEPGHERILLVATGPLSELASTPRDLILDRLLGGWQEFAEVLDRALVDAFPGTPHTPRVTLEIEPGPLAALPWEIAPSLRNCEVLHRAAFQRASRSLTCEIPRNQPEAVRLLLPRANESRRESNSYQGAAGVDLERLYYFAAETVPAVSYSPTPEELHRELSNRPCAVLHIVAAVREFSGGIFLDFESTEARIDQVRGEEYSFLTPTYLDRVLASLKNPPFVVLDIARSDNDAETLRRLLLRNTYADHLFQLGNTCGILASGLVDRFSQEFTAGPLIREVMNGAPMGQVARLVRANQQPTSPYSPFVTELPSLGAALFTDNPDLSPFAPPGRQA